MSFASLRRVLRAARKGLCATCSKTRYPQLEAAGSGHVGCLIYTLETIGGLIKDEHDVTAMHVAARKGQISILIYIIENNIIEKKDIPRAVNGATPAHDAAGTGNLECLRYLLNSTMASPNDLDSNSATPLHWAAQNGQLKIVQWLVIDAKAPIDVVTKNGVTPFHLASVKNNLEVLRFLVSYAFRTHPRPMKLINVKDKNGSTPVFLGAHAGNVDVVKWLTEKGGGDPTIVNRQGMAPLHAAASNGHIECVKFLFQFGLGTAPGGMRTTEGASALHFAAAEGEIEIVQWMLNQEECTGNERDYYQSTPLHDAAENGHLIALKALCDHGCDPALLDVEGNKPSDLARKHGHSKCSGYLDSYMKRVMWSRINGVKMSEDQPKRKIHRNVNNKSQIMDKFRNAPPHIMPINAFEEDEDTNKDSSASKHPTISDNQWVTVRDLLEEDEIKKLNENDVVSSSPRKVQRLTEANMKRRLFEEKLAKEQEERHQKKMIALKQKKEQEDEIRHQFIEGDDNDIQEALKSFDDVLFDQQTELGSKKLKHDKDSYPGQNTKIEKQLEEGMERNGSNWISQILRKRASSLESNATKPIRKPRRRGSDPSEWNIPSPPPPPKVKFLMGKNKRIQSQSFKNDVRKEVLASKWGREAYDDINDSNENSIVDSNENIGHLQHKQTKINSNSSVANKTPLKVTEQHTKKHILVRRDTPKPNDLLINSKDMKRESTKPTEKLQVTAPIAKLASARTKPSKSTVPLQSSKSTPVASKEIGKATVSEKLPNQNLPKFQSPLNEEANEFQDRDDEGSSEEDDSSDYESTDTSVTDEDDDDDDRPIMAQNMGIHGAKIARQVMQRMKNQRYPSIFSKPIIKLDTIKDVRYESPYQTNSNPDKADVLRKLQAEKKVWDSWRKHVQIVKFSRNQAEKMLQRRKKGLIAEVFYAWVQAKNESEVEKAEKKQQAIRHYKLKLKARVITNWKEIVNQEIMSKKPKNIHQKYLHWLNIQLTALHKNKVTDLLKSLEDGTLIITIIAHLSGKKQPKHKTSPKIKLHFQDNWRVAHQFMEKVGIHVKDFEPADLANLHEASILNMFNNILKWTDKRSQ